MDFNQFDIVLITDEKQRLYFLTFASTDGYAILTKEKKYLVIDSRYLYAAKQVLTPKGIEVVEGRDFTYFVNLVNSINAKKVGIDFNYTSLSTFETLKNLLPNAQFVNVSCEIAGQMSVKTQNEIDTIQKACEIAQRSFNEVLPFIKEGVTERQLANELEYRFKKYGASDKSFDTIVAFNENSAVPHHQTSDKPLTPNSVVLMDFGCIYNGYCSDMTRTLFFGNPTQKFLNVYNAVYDANINALENITSGMTGQTADKLARDVLAERGLDSYFTHSLGHGIGVNIHEYPNLSPKAESVVLLDNMVFSDEPGVYLDGEFGVRIEDSCYLKNGKAYSFMTEDKKLIVINNGKIGKYN